MSYCTLAYCETSPELENGDVKEKDVILTASTALWTYSENMQDIIQLGKIVRTNDN